MMLTVLLFFCLARMDRKQTHTKTIEPVAAVGMVPAAKRSAAIGGAVVPRATALHAVGVIPLTDIINTRIDCAIDAMAVHHSIPLIAAPFPHVAMHIVQTVAAVSYTHLTLPTKA